MASSDVGGSQILSGPLAGLPAAMCPELRAAVEAHVEAEVAARLATAERRLRLAQEAGRVGTYETSIVSGISTGTPRTWQLLGLDPDLAAVPYGVWWEVIHPDDRDWVQSQLRERLSRGQEEGSIEYRIVVGGEIRWVSACDRLEYGEDGRAVSVAGVLQDITERKRAHERVQQAERRLRQAQEAGRIGTYEIDLTSGITTGTPRFYQHMGLPESSVSLDRGDWLAIIHPDDRVPLAERLREILRSGDSDNVVEYRVVVDGKVRWISSCDRVERDAAGRAIFAYGAVQDITARRLAEQQIWHAAHHDLLTGLPNRLLFGQRLRELLDSRPAGGDRIGLLMIDLDRLKSANDSHGHRAGDYLLRSAAERMIAAAPGATAARLGGDEFVLALPVATAADLHAVADRVVRSLGAPLGYGGATLECGASIGTALFPDDAASSDSLMHAADIAMCVAKLTGRGRSLTYSASLDAELTRLTGTRARVRLVA